MLANFDDLANWLSKSESIDHVKMHTNEERKREVFKKYVHGTEEEEFWLKLEADPLFDALVELLIGACAANDVSEDELKTEMTHHPGLTWSVIERFRQHLIIYGKGVKSTTTSPANVDTEREVLGAVTIPLMELERRLARIVEEVMKRKLKARGWPLKELNHGIFWRITEYNSSAPATVYHFGWPSIFNCAMAAACPKESSLNVLNRIDYRGKDQQTLKDDAIKKYGHPIKSTNGTEKFIVPLTKLEKLDELSKTNRIVNQLLNDKNFCACEKCVEKISDLSSRNRHQKTCGLGLAEK